MSTSWNPYKNPECGAQKVLDWWNTSMCREVVHPSSTEAEALARVTLPGLALRMSSPGWSFTLFITLLTVNSDMYFPVYFSLCSVNH